VGSITGRLHVRSETGDIFLRQVGGEVDATTDYGDLIVSGCVGSLKASVLRGTIRVGTMAGPCDLVNSSGDVEVMGAKGGGRVSAEAGNAIVTMARDFVGEMDVRTSGGAIFMNVDPAAKCDIEAKTSLFSHVDNRLPLQVLPGRASRRKLVGRLNGGGPEVRLHASGGDVRLATAQMLLE
jgi:hypothetical protein